MWSHPDHFQHHISKIDRYEILQPRHYCNINKCCFAFVNFAVNDQACVACWLAHLLIRQNFLAALIGQMNCGVEGERPFSKFMVWMWA